MKAEIELRQFNDAKIGNRLDIDGKPVLINSRGIPYNYKSTFLLKILIALDKFLFKK